MQFQQADFERECFLHVGVQQPLAFVPASADFPAPGAAKSGGQRLPRRKHSGISADLCRRRACAARCRAATIARAAANRRGDGDIRLRWRRRVRPPIFRANLFRPLRIFRAASARSAIRPRASGFHRVFAVAHRAAGSGPADFFAPPAASAPKFSSHSASAQIQAGAAPSPEKFRRRQRDKIVSKIRDGSVESRIKTEFGGGSSRVLRKALAACAIQPVGSGDDRHLEFRLGRFELDLLHQIPHLFDGDDARFGFGPRPMDVGVGFVVNFPAAQTFVAAIRRHAVRFDRVLAVQNFGQRAGEQFQIVKLVACEQVSVPEPSARQRALQQLDALRLRWEIFEGHAFL